MLFLASSNLVYAKDYRNIISFLEDNNISYNFFVTKRMLNELKKLGSNPKGSVVVNYNLTPWIKDYAPQIYIPSMRNHDGRGFLLFFKYKPFYLKRVGKSFSEFQRYFEQRFVKSQGISSISIDKPLDGGAVLTLVKEDACLIIMVDEWDINEEVFTSIFGSDSKIQLLKVPVENYFKHIDGVLSLFPSLTQDNTYCLVYLDDETTRSWIDKVCLIISDFLKIKVNAFPVPVDDSYRKFIIDYRHYSCVVNSVVFPEIGTYAFLSYDPVSEMMSILNDVGFLSFLNAHGYKPAPILGDNLLRNGGGLACVVYNAWFLKPFTLSSKESLQYN